MGNPTLGRQLHKRRLMPAPRPFILDPLPDAYTLFSSGKGTPELGWNGPKQVEYDIHGRRVKQESEAEAENQDEIAQAAREVEMLLQQGLPTPLDTPPRTAAVDSSEVHWTEREEKVFEEALGLELFKLQEAPAAGLVRQPRLGDSPRNNTHTDLLYKYPNIDEAWLRHTLAYQKPDGRKYRLHEKRRRPPPQPILAPSVYSQELAPAYTTAELDKLTPGEFRGFGRKHDLVSFYTTGKPLPGPSLSEIAAKGAPLQERLDKIHETDNDLLNKVETLWRLKQSWSMQKPENSPWSSPLRRPKALQQAPGRQFRTNINVHDLSAATVRDCQEGYDITNGTLCRVGVESTPVVGRWSLFADEPRGQAEPPPEDFHSDLEIQKELRRRPPKQEVVEEVGLGTQVDVNKGRDVMRRINLEMGELDAELAMMRRDLNITDPSRADDEEDEEEPRLPTLTEDLAAMNKRLERNKALQSNKNQGTGYVYVRPGEKPLEVELKGGDGAEGGDLEDDLEDLIKKPKRKRPPPHVDCFNPLCKESVHRSRGGGLG